MRTFHLAFLVLAFAVSTISACGQESDVDLVEPVDELALGQRCGDVNNSGSITVTDSVLAGNYANGSATPTAAQRWAADVNANGTVTSSDATQIQRAAAGLSASLNCATFGPLVK